MGLCYGLQTQLPHDGSIGCYLALSAIRLEPYLPLAVGCVQAENPTRSMTVSNTPQKRDDPVQNGGNDKPEQPKPPEFEQETPHDPPQPEKADEDR